MMARFGASRRVLGVWVSVGPPSPPCSSTSGISYLASVVRQGPSPDLQNCVTSTASVKLNPSYSGPNIAKTLVETEGICDPVPRAKAKKGSEGSSMRRLQNFVGGAYRDA